MALDEFTRKQVEEKLGRFCESRIPPHVRGEIRLTFSFWKDSVILYEERPHWREPEVWTKMKIARMDFDEASRGWTLWAYDRNDRPLFYIDLDANVSLDDVLSEIDTDPTGIFWG